MNPELLKVITDAIFDGMMSQDFKDWHDGKFNDFVTGDMAHELGIAQSTAEVLIKQDIHRLFRLK